MQTQRLLTLLIWFIILKHSHKFPLHRIRCHPAKGQGSGGFKIENSATVRGNAIGAKWIILTIRWQFNITSQWYQSRTISITFGFNLQLEKWCGMRTRERNMGAHVKHTKHNATHDPQRERESERERKSMEINEMII